MKRLLWFLILLSPSALAGGALSLGSGDDTRLARASWVHPWEKGRFSGVWELSLARWQRDARGFEGGVTDVSLTPILRLGRGHVFAEGGVGVHLLDGLDHVEDRLSGALQFGSLLGLGIRGGRWELGARLQHLSNAGLSRPNRGINFLLLHIAFWPGGKGPGRRGR